MRPTDTIYPPVFDENYAAEGIVIIDSHKRKWKILEERHWYNLDIMSLDQHEEKTRCRHIAVVNTIQGRNRIVEMRRPQNEKRCIGDVGGDSLSPKHLLEVAPDAVTGLQLFAKLTTTPITTKSEYESKVKDQDDDLKEIDGCTAHLIKDYGFIYGDYRKGRGNKLEHRRNKLSRFHLIRDELEKNGPVYASIRLFKYGKGIDRALFYYTPAPNEKINECKGYHAITIMGWGRCKLVKEGDNEIMDGCVEVYWLGKNTWGEGSPPKFVRVNTDLVTYIVHPVV